MVLFFRWEMVLGEKIAQKSLGSLTRVAEMSQGDNRDSG